MPVETPSLFSKVILEHLELKRRNAGLDGNMPLARYMVDDPFSNHPLFKSEEQARIEETMDGPSHADVTMLLNVSNEDTAEHAVLPAGASAEESAAQAAAATPAAPSFVAAGSGEAGESDAAPSATSADAAAPLSPDETAWGQSRDFDWGD